MNNKSNAIRQTYILMLMLVLCPISVSAQHHLVARVSDAKTGEALPYASVFIDSQHSTITNADGDFAINTDSTAVLRISHVGYKTLHISAMKVGKNIHLQPDGKILDEVIVMGSENIVKQVRKKLRKELRKNKRESSNLFYREMTYTGSQCTDFIECFFQGRTAIQLRDLSLVTGRYFAVASSHNSVPVNFHSLAQIPVLNTTQYTYDQMAPLHQEFKKLYMTDCQTLINGDEKTYVLTMIARNPKRWSVEGKLYVDGNTYELLKFEGIGLNERVKRVVQGKVYILPVDYSFVVNYQHDNGYAEVLSVHFNLRYRQGEKQYETNGLMFNAGQQTAKGTSKVEFYDNLIKKIKELGYNRQLWDDIEIVKRTPMEEEAIELMAREDLFGVY
ncbi:MAG: carboxypeptidase-like regulatory domain-containing protein [Prevotella sp.]|nr:carboxypeptidase-like regulatory domain-containing protein [Prevotella sp.]